VPHHRHDFTWFKQSYNQFRKGKSNLKRIRIGGAGEGIASEKRVSRQENRPYFGPYKIVALRWGDGFDIGEGGR
jgi:hypothetical protein